MFTASDRFDSLESGHHLLATNLGHKISKKAGRNLYPTEAIQERKHLTVDTNENRFVKHFLQTVQHRLKGLLNILTSSIQGYLNPDIEQHLEEMTRGIAALLADPLWHDVGSMAFIPVSSQVLHRREGYRQLFQLYSLLQLTSRCDFFNKDDFQNLLETKDTPTLFEYWSFFVVKDILDAMLKIKTCRSIISDSPLEQNLVTGICIRYEGDIVLWFNRTFRGTSGSQPGDRLTCYEENHESYSHDLRPDIVIEKNNNRLIFDAKLKGQRNGFYGENEDGSIGSWKPEDIDKMHCYREAINGVIGAYILYPGEKAGIYYTHNATRICEGVGAYPLRPEAGARPAKQHLEYLENVIKEFIAV
jgi:uncharacterized protein